MSIIQQTIHPKLSPLFSLLAFALVVALGCFAQAGAQWTTPDASQNINNTNTGNVGIGTSTPTSKLEVNGRIKQSGSATDAGYLVTNSGQLASTTALNPGIALFGGNGVNALYGADLGYNSISSRYRTRIFSGNVLADVALGRQQNAQGNPTQSAFLEFLTVRGDTGNVGIGTESPGERLVTLGNILAGNITSHTQLYSGYDNQSNVIMELGYGTATANVTPLPSLVLSKNLTSTGQALGVISFANSNIANGSEKRLTTISTWTDGALNSGALVITTASAGTLDERMRITSSGRVGIGTTTPGYAFDLVGANPWIARFKKTDNSNGGIIIDSATGYNPNLALAVNGTNKWYLLSNASGSDALQFWESSGTQARFTLTQGGTVGIGTGTPNSSYKLDVQGGSINSSGGLCIAGDCKTAWSQVGGSQWTTSGTTINYATGNVGIATATPTEKLHVTGNVKIVGDIDVSGNIKAKYQDLAEWVESSQDLPAGTVVVLDNSKANQVIASTQAYDSRVAGVISLNPGLQLGEQGEGRVLVATTGRVRVKVDASKGPIQIGDLLVTSDKTGTAMKSVPVTIGGVSIHRPGTLIGKALEPLAQGTGEILVLLSLQ